MADCKFISTYSKSQLFVKIKKRLSTLLNIRVYAEITIVCRFYTCAIKLNPEDSLLWHELSLCYYYFALQYGKDAETRKRHLRLAMDASKQSIQLQPSRWQNWNLLGVICTTNGEFKGFKSPPMLYSYF